VTDILRPFSGFTGIYSHKESIDFARQLYIASQGHAEKNRRLRKILEEAGYQKLLQSGEKEFLLLTNAKTGTRSVKMIFLKTVLFHR
jgi:hypothetical protein